MNYSKRCANPGLQLFHDSFGTIVRLILKYYDYFSRIVKAGLFLITLAPIAHLFRRFKAYKNIWLVTERPDEARDNGYHFYKFLISSHPEIKVFYIIKHQAADFQRIRAIGPWIEYGTLRHYFFFAISRVSISSHSYGAAPFGRAASLFVPILPKKLTVSLRHGISKDHFSIYTKEKGKIDLLICGAKPEFEYLSANCGYRPGRIVYTGLARYDNLCAPKIQEDQHLILVMPTFRKWIFDLTRLPAKMAVTSFRKEPYFIQFNDLLNLPTLHDLLNASNMKLIFYPHYSAQPFLSEFRSTSDRIVIANRGSYDIQSLLISSSTLVTDYSSVFFDFGYMNKPVIYFQFDDEAYRTNHYREGWFSYEKDGFGPICRSPNDVVDKLKELIDLNFEPEEVYKKRMLEFFPLKGSSNCERIFDAMNVLLGDH